MQGTALQIEMEMSNSDLVENTPEQCEEPTGTDLDKLMKRPPEFSECLIHIKPLGKCLDTHDECDYMFSSEINVVIGKGISPLAEKIDECLLTMIEGDTAVVETESRAVKAVSLRQDDTKDIDMCGSLMQVELRLISILCHGTPIFKLDVHGKLNRGVQLKEKGVIQFKSCNFMNAFNSFSHALKYFICMGKECEIPQELKEQVVTLKAQCYSNIAACQLKVDNWPGAIDNCTKALALQPRLTKALFRRGQAYSKQGKYDLADEDLKIALTLEPKNESVISLHGYVKDQMNK